MFLCQSNKNYISTNNYKKILLFLFLFLFLLKVEDSIYTPQKRAVLDCLWGPSEVSVFFSKLSSNISRFPHQQQQ